MEDTEARCIYISTSEIVSNSSLENSSNTPLTCPIGFYSNRQDKPNCDYGPESAQFYLNSRMLIFERNSIAKVLVTLKS